ncbi:hypothetical protein [Pseudomonas putida]|uniref:hypothetical protein n=1 Tax=Pseudomonas putida TaxID=303 RepID=UPI002B24341C|nr:hypothetical protein [Pseudomonas putida]
MDIIPSIVETINSFDFTPLKSLVDLNDLRNLAAILGVGLGVRAASLKWGHKAIHFATIGKSINSPARITNLSIANLKDKPLIVYEIIVLLREQKRYFRLQKFDPPLVIKSLEATSIAPDAYSDLDITPNPFTDIETKFEIHLITNSKVIKCKPAHSPEALAHKHFKKYQSAATSSKRFNGKIYTNEARLALVYTYKGAQHTSFLLKSGFICDEWPFRTNSIPKDMMINATTISESLSVIGQQYGISIAISELPTGSR